MACNLLSADEGDVLNSSNSFTLRLACPGDAERSRQFMPRLPRHGGLVRRRPCRMKQRCGNGSARHRRDILGRSRFGNGDVVGHAYGSKHRERAADPWSVDFTRLRSAGGAKGVKSGRLYTVANEDLPMSGATTGRLPGFTHRMKPVSGSTRKSGFVPSESISESVSSSANGMTSGVGA